MSTTTAKHLAALIAEAVAADRRNDAAARHRARHEAVDVYAYCSARTWARRFAAAK